MLKTTKRATHYLAQFFVILLISLQPAVSSAQLSDQLDSIEPYSAPSFEHVVDWINLPNSDNQKFHNKVILVNFWATWCPPCIEELPTIQQVWQANSQSQFEVVAVNVGEPKDTVVKFLKTIKPDLEFPVAIDEQLTIYQEWEVSPLPTSFLVDKNGYVRYKVLGGRDFNGDNIRRIIRQLIEE